jgi:hypothetical protein
MGNGPTVGDVLTPLIDKLKSIRTDWPKRGWSWDTRLNAASSSFSADLEQAAHTAVKKTLTTEWNAATLNSAPQHVKDIAQKSGGVRSGQLVLATPPSGRYFAYGLWWPWGDGLTISLRVGLAGAEFREEVLQRVRDAFAIEM